jgi:hypothetical protein
VSAADGERDEPRFGGGGRLDELVDAPSELPRPPQPRWFLLLEQALNQVRSTEDGRARYGDPQRGATLEQAWRTRGLFGDQPTCLVSTRFANARTGEIADTARLEPAALVQALAHVLARPRTSVQVFLHDGRRGHCVTLHRAIPDRAAFEYQDPWPRGVDPWPEGSFLAAGRNQAGVAAEPLGNRWSVTAAELERVLYAAFVSRGAWMLVNGSEFRVSYSRLQETEFWSWFHLREAGRGDGPDGMTRVHVAPGSFEDDIGIGLELEAGDWVRVARLTLRRSWVTPGDASVNPLAPDITASFVRALIPAADAASVDAVAGLLASTNQSDAVRQRLAEDAQLEPFARAFLGGPDAARLPLELSILSLANEESNDDRWLVIEVATS